MYRWSKIPKKYCPKIITDISDDKFLTFVVHDGSLNKLKRKLVSRIGPLPAVHRHQINDTLGFGIDVAWEGYYFHPSQSFKNIIDKNIPCVIMYKVKNDWAPWIDTVVCFMTGECNDVFLVSPRDLTEWDPNEII